MKRFCANCQKEIDFKITSIKDLDNLICPECKNPVPKNSFKPNLQDQIGTEKTINAIGSTLMTIMYIAYYFYFALAIAGVIFFYFKLNTLLYISTGINLCIFIIQLLTGFKSFKWGIPIIPVAAIIGLFVLKGIPGACFSIQLVFIIRFVLRDIFFRLLLKLVSFAIK